MLFVITRWLAGVAALPCLLTFAQAPTERGEVSADVSVRNVRIERVREAGGWLEAGVHLAVSPGAGGVRYADRVKIAVSMAYETDRTRDAALRCYRAEVEVITLPTGTSVVRFYLPPEVVERDHVRSEDLHWLVELSQGGHPVPLAPAAVSASLRNPERLDRFRARVASDAPVNEGILVPQYLTPFAHDPRRPAPTCVR